MKLTHTLNAIIIMASSALAQSVLYKDESTLGFFPISDSYNFNNTGNGTGVDGDFCGDNLYAFEPVSEYKSTGVSLYYQTSYDYKNTHKTSQPKEGYITLCTVRELKVVIGVKKNCEPLLVEVFAKRTNGYYEYWNIKITQPTSVWDPGVHCLRGFGPYTKGDFVITTFHEQADGRDGYETSNNYTGEFFVYEYKLPDQNISVYHDAKTKTLVGAASIPGFKNHKLVGDEKYIVQFTNEAPKNNVPIASTSSSSTVTQGTPTYHTVVSGNTLYNISRTYGVSIDDLKRWNNLNDNTIHLGQRLVIGSQENSEASRSNTESTNHPIPGTMNSEKRLPDNERILQEREMEKANIRNNCWQCKGSGFYSANVTCDKCNGEGEVEEKCGKCYGTGDVYCSRCEGAGFNFAASMIKAFGDGFSGQSQSEPVPCSSCDGSGKKECYECRGSGETMRDCFFCNGTGRSSEQRRCTLHE